MPAFVEHVKEASLAIFCSFLRSKLDSESDLRLVKLGDLKLEDDLKNKVFMGQLVRTPIKISKGPYIFWRFDARDLSDDSAHLLAKVWIEDGFSDITLRKGDFFGVTNAQVAPANEKYTSSGIVVRKKFDNAKVWVMTSQSAIDSIRLDSPENSVATALPTRSERSNTGSRQISQVDNGQSLNLPCVAAQQSATINSRQNDSTSAVQVEPQPIKPKSGKTNPYKYTKIKDLDLGTHHVIGVVREVKPVTVSQRGFSFVTVHVNDQSSPKTLVVTIFVKDPAVLPDIGNDDIIRFHRLKVDDKNTNIFAKISFERDFCVWASPEYDLTKPRTSAKTYSFTDEEAEEVRSLSSWISSLRGPVKKIPLASIIAAGSVTNERTTAIKDMKTGYYNLVCQVVDSFQPISTSEEDLFVLRVWDNTRPPYPSVVWEPPSNHSNCATYLVLKEEVIEIAIYGQKYTSVAKHLKPGDIVMLGNLHSKKYDPSPHFPCKNMAFYMHAGGEKFRRCMRVIQGHQRETFFATLKDGLEKKKIELDEAKQARASLSRSTEKLGRLGSGEDKNNNSTGSKVDCDARSTMSVNTQSSFTKEGQGREVAAQDDQGGRDCDSEEIPAKRAKLDVATNNNDNTVESETSASGTSSSFIDMVLDASQKTHQSSLPRNSSIGSVNSATAGSSCSVELACSVPSLGRAAFNISGTTPLDEHLTQDKNNKVANKVGQKNMNASCNEIFIASGSSSFIDMGLDASQKSHQSSLPLNSSVRSVNSAASGSSSSVELPCSLPSLGRARFDISGVSPFDELSSQDTKKNKVYNGQNKLNPSCEIISPVDDDNGLVDLESLIRQMGEGSDEDEEKLHQSQDEDDTLVSETESEDIAKRKVSHSVVNEQESFEASVIDSDNDSEHRFRFNRSRTPVTEIKNESRRVFPSVIDLVSPELRNDEPVASSSRTLARNGESVDVQPKSDQFLERQTLASAKNLLQATSPRTSLRLCHKDTKSPPVPVTADGVKSVASTSRCVTENENHVKTYTVKPFTSYKTGFITDDVWKSPVTPINKLDTRSDTSISLIRAKVVAFKPSLKEPMDLLRLYCTRCGKGSLNVTVDEKRELKNIECASCPGVTMEYYFHIAIMVCDESEEKMLVHICKDAAKAFFDGATPKLYVENAHVQKKSLSLLRRLCPHANDQCSWEDCRNPSYKICVRCVTIGGKQHYYYINHTGF